MDLGLRDRVVMVTGGSSGIGAAIAEAFGRERARVVLTYRSDAASARAVAKRVEAAGGQATVVRYDLGDPVSITAAVDEVSQTWGPVEALIANAVRWPQRSPEAAFEKLAPAVWQPDLRDNIDGVFATVQAVLPGMRANGWGRILFISTGVAEEGMAGTETYGAAKAALHGLARSLAWGVGASGILVNVLVAGFTMTDRNQRRVPEPVRRGVAARIPSRRLSYPDEVALPAVFLASAANRTITGEILHEGSSTGRSSHAA